MEENRPAGGAPDEISKSQRRRDALEIRALAARLVGLSPAQLAQVPLDEPLRAEIERARTIRSNSARKRQLQFVAKLMRRGDPEEILAALAAFDQEARQLTARHHRSEAWRDHLLAAGDAAIGELFQQRRDADVQALRQLVRNAQREARADRPPAAARALFRALRALDEAEPLPPPAAD
ncbi:MAG: ribosome biogenesis factor YjgA [Xanthomonadales bacterium]